MIKKKKNDRIIKLRNKKRLLVLYDFLISIIPYCEEDEMNFSFAAGYIFRSKRIQSLSGYLISTIKLKKTG